MSCCLRRFLWTFRLTNGKITNKLLGFWCWIPDNQTNSLVFIWSEQAILPCLFQPLTVWFEKNFLWSRYGSIQLSIHDGITSSRCSLCLDQTNSSFQTKWVIGWLGLLTFRLNSRCRGHQSQRGHYIISNKTRFDSISIISSQMGRSGNPLPLPLKL